MVPPASHARALQFNNTVNLWLWIMLGQFLLWMCISMSVAVRRRRFVARLAEAVDCVHHRFRGRGVLWGLHHHHHAYYRSRHVELCITVEGVQVVPVVPMYAGAPPQYYQAPTPPAAAAAVPVQGYSMPPGYQAVPGPHPSAPAFQAPPPGYHDFDKSVQ